MIQIENIQKTFGSNRVLKGITSTFETGKTNLIIGQSGSGKTVLLKCIIGLLNPDEGDILYDQRPLSEMDKNTRTQLRTEMGVLFQGSALFDSMSVIDNVLFPLRMFSPLNEKAQRDRALYCLDRVGLQGKETLFPSEISGGMQKRAAIARAIALNPKYLFCDEPNSGLDPLTSIKIDELITDITREFQMTTIINTHDMNSVIEIGNKVAFIYKGKLWWEGDNNMVLDTDNEELNNFVYATELTRRLKK